MYFMRSAASHNNIFTHRGTSPLGPADDLRCRFGEVSQARKQIQPDTPAPPNRIAAGTSSLKVVGRREYQNVS